MTKLRAILLFIGLTLGVYADSWLVGGQPVNPFELWAGNDLSIDPETGELIVIHGIDLSGYPDARILLDHDATNDNEVVNYRTATNLIAQTGSGSGNPFDQDLNTSDSPAFERVTFGSGNFEDGFESTVTGFRINDMSNFDVINIASHRLFDRFNDELALTWTLGAGGRNLLGRWSIIFDATNDQEIVNYRVLTNKIAQLAGGGGDNLGNHTATAELNLGNTNALTGVKEISFWDEANGLATASVFENWFRFAGSGFGIQASELKADDFLTAGSGNTQITLGDNETTIKGEDLLLLEGRNQSILRSVSNGDTLIESGSPSDNEPGEIFITSKHNGDALGGEILIRAQHPPEEGTRGHIMFEGDITFSNGSISVGSIIIQDGSSDITGVNEVFAGAVNVGNQQLAESDSGLTLFDLNASVARQVLSGFTGVSAESDFVREVVFPLVDDIRPAFTNSPVIILSLGTPVSEWVMVNLLSSSETNFTYEIMTSGGAVDDSWPVNWAAYARTP